MSLILIMSVMLTACNDDGETTTTTTTITPPTSGLTPEEQRYIDRLNAATEAYIDKCEAQSAEPQPYILTEDENSGYFFLTRITKGNGYSYSSSIIEEDEGYEYLCVKNTGDLDNMTPESKRSQVYYDIQDLFNEVYYGGDGYAISNHGDFTTCFYPEDKGVYVYFTKVGNTVGMQTVRWIFSFDELNGSELTDKGFPSAVHSASEDPDEYDFLDFHSFDGESITSDCKSRYTCTDCEAEYTSSAKVHDYGTTTVRELDTEKAKAEVYMCSICRDATLILSDSNGDKISITYTAITSDRVTKYGISGANNKVMIDDMTYSGGENEFDRILDIPDVSAVTGKTLVGIRDKAYSTISENVPLRVVYPEGIVFMESGAISFNASHVSLPDSLTYMADNAIRNKATLTELTLPKNLTYFGSHDLPHLTSLTVNCDHMTEMRIPIMESYDDITFNIQSVDKLYYHNEYTGKTVIIPKGIGQVLGLTNLTDVEKIEIHDINIGWSINMFTGCINVKEIILPEGLTSLPAFCFKDFSKLETIKLIKDNGDIIGNDGEILIPEGLTEIPVYAFQNCSSVKKVILHSGITKIGYDAFSNCTKLAYIRLNENITEIGARAFMGCELLGNECFTVGNALKLIGERAFCGTAITEFTVPVGVNEVEYRAFAQTELEHLVIKGEIKNGGSEIAGINIKEITFEKAFKLYGVYGTTGTEIVNIKFVTASNNAGRVIHEGVSTVNFAGTEAQFIALGFELAGNDTVVNYEVSF